MNKVWLTGDAVVDLIPDGKNSFVKCPGGAPANVAVGIARLGGDCGFFGRVGLDPFGVFMQQTLESENVAIEHLALDEKHRTSTVLVDLDASGERSFTFLVKPSADQFMTESEIPAFHAGEWLHTCSISLANEPSRSSTLEAMRRVKRAGGFISFDPNLREEVWLNPEEMVSVVMAAVRVADVVKFSKEELLLLTDTESIEQGLEALTALQLPLVLITQGEKGCLGVFQGKQFQVPTKSANVVDTTGAGDAFVSGLLARLSQQNHWQDHLVVSSAIEWGNACGGLATTQKGAMTALPSESELRQWLDS
ncbi:aminoimidazole riboside kinase [uncultured Vibrio sp.]|uniref:aminoimidazole riboside kinase n=1 Tax=uncultured Vibrio sp. TaxID=114054 RepID=UPI0025FF883D|nr:aminoimidazole riboside kinase [uncultured Vibrio sp.]